MHSPVSLASWVTLSLSFDICQCFAASVKWPKLASTNSCQIFASKYLYYMIFHFKTNYWILVVGKMSCLSHMHACGKFSTFHKVQYICQKKIYIYAKGKCGCYLSLNIHVGAMIKIVRSSPSLGGGIKVVVLKMTHWGIEGLHSFMCNYYLQRNDRAWRTNNAFLKICLGVYRLPDIFVK